MYPGQFLFQLLLDRIASGMLENLSKASSVEKFWFNFAYEYKKRWRQLGFSTPIVDEIFFHRTRNILGGRVRKIITAGAPMTAKIHSIIRHCFCTNLNQGYGLTETSGSATTCDSKCLSSAVEF